MLNQEDNSFQKLFDAKLSKKEKPDTKSGSESMPENITQASPTIVGGAETTKDAPQISAPQENTLLASEPKIKSETPISDSWDNIQQIADILFNVAIKYNWSFYNNNFSCI